MSKSTTPNAHVAELLKAAGIRAVARDTLDSRLSFKTQVVMQGDTVVVDYFLAEGQFEHVRRGVLNVAEMVLEENYDVQYSARGSLLCTPLASA